MFEKIDIEKVKEELRNCSINYRKNFTKIEKFIENEIHEILNLKENNKSIIPEISFNQIYQNKTKVIEDIKKRGCVIIRDVFEDKFIANLNFQLEKYIDENNYYEDQKKKADLDKYFSDLKSGKPQIYGLYWSKAQIEIRHSDQMAKVQRWLNNLWIYENEEYKVFDPNKELSYADRVRRREPGDDTLGLSPHCDAGSVERWTDKNYQKIYQEIFADNFEKYDPFNAKFRDRIIEFESPAVAHVFRTFKDGLLNRAGSKRRYITINTYCKRNGVCSYKSITK